MQYTCGHEIVEHTNWYGRGKSREARLAKEAERLCPVCGLEHVRELTREFRAFTFKNEPLSLGHLALRFIVRTTKARQRLQMETKKNK